jgi:hypothetical protein
MEKELLIKFGMVKKSYHIINTIELVLIILGIYSTTIAIVGLFISQTLYAIGFVTLCITIFPVIPIMKISDRLRWNMIRLKRDLRIAD